MFNINIELVKKYDRPGPRYTSYPTAPQFHDNFTGADYISEIKRTNDAANPPDLSLYFHIPFCDTLCYFCGCNMIISRNRERIHKYIDYVKKEIDLISGFIKAGRKVSQLHWGGGTPTHLKPEEIRELSSYISEKFIFSGASENGCEIDPRELSKEHLVALRESGFNRISMGVQDFNEKVQKAVNRIQPEELTIQVVDWVRELGFDSINLDLIYGLPFQTVEEFEKTVDKIIEISPDRIALFNYAHVPWMKKHMSLINPDDIPVPEVKLEILKMSVAKLTAAGYTFIGMDHFAKPGDDLSKALKEKRLYRNFQGYSTNAGTDLYAMGITSISQIGNAYAQNMKNEKEYYEAIDAGQIPVVKGYLMNADDVLRKQVIMKVMCDFELDFTEVENKFDIRFEDYFAWGIENIKELEDDGLISIKNRKLTVNEMGRLLIRNVAMNFDGFLERKVDTAKYSRTV
ncbi:MAG: oxygen-independent coproporphyrinogen III oxidase [Melioribacteraceae bacterium]|nr:oxygen-independent coproporphyrinogen III oxidase [Melioribacteraceae bacterium]